MEKEDKVQKAKDLFLAVSPYGWHEANIKVPQGAQANVLVVDNETGLRGVFRHLAMPANDDELKRFQRELRILSYPDFQNPSILRLLAHTENDVPWYISEYGTPFNLYWDNIRKKYEDDPEHIVLLAVQHLSQILTGLEIMHKQGVVHRDIKPQNIIIIDGKGGPRAVLIDFGVAFREDEERLTKVNEAIGNKRYSHDVAMNRMDEITPWLDVYQIIQVFMHLIEEKPVMHYWSRPVDWQWVNYDKRLSKDSTNAIWAISGICSHESISPKDAGELLKLFNELFPFSRIKVSELDFKEDVKGIILAKAQGKAEKISQDVKITEVIIAEYPSANEKYEKLEEYLLKLTSDLNSSGVELTFEKCGYFNSFRDTVIENGIRNSSVDLFKIICGDIPNATFIFNVQALYHPPFNPARERPTDTTNHFTFILQKFTHATLGPTIGFPSKTTFLSLERTGELILHDKNMENPRQVNFNEIIEMVKEWLTDPVSWKALQSVNLNS